MSARSTMMSSALPQPRELPTSHRSGRAIVTPGMANAVTFTGSSGNRAASVNFTVVGGNLQVVLTNTSSADVLVPTDVLTAVFFSISAGTLTRSSAVLSAGSAVFYDSAPPGGVVGGEWEDKDGLRVAPDWASAGLSTSALGLCGSAERYE